MKTGLVSVTFRKLQPQEIVDLVAQAGLDGIEWGGDIHCPPGQVRKAKEVRAMTVDAGLEVAAYGSYFYPGESKPEEISKVVETAKALQAPTIRVWAGKKGSASASPEYRQRVIEQTQQIADMAAAEGIVIAYEYHQNTLTDTNESAVATIEEVGRDNFRLYWQPLRFSAETRLAGLKAILPKLANFHVYYLDPEKGRMPLAAGEADWLHYFSLISPGGNGHWAMLEFVRDDAPEAFLEDSAALKSIVGRVNA